jgi:DNA (cytosine-5)-methyltransferase 1
MTHGSLFSGIGGFDLAAEWMGWENIFHCEWNPFGQKVLNHYWPNAKSYHDIKKTDFTIHRESIDILTGGFPCQPYSLAGKRKGKEDERHLWPEMLRAIREIQPRWVVGENVFGLINWSDGLVFNEVQTDLEAEGYEVFPYVLPACAVNAPHRRDRVWFVAYSNSHGCNGSNRKHEINTSKSGIDAQRNIEQMGGNVTNTNSSGLWGKTNRYGESRQLNENSKGINWENFPTQSPICGGDDGLPTNLDGITFSKWRNESIKAFGNAIVPQVALQIFKSIEEFATTLQK